MWHLYSVPLSYKAEGPWALFNPKLDAFGWGTPDTVQTHSPLHHTTTHNHNLHSASGETESEQGKDPAQPTSFDVLRRMWPDSVLPQ